MSIRKGRMGKTMRIIFLLLLFHSTMVFATEEKVTKDIVDFLEYVNAKSTGILDIISKFDEFGTKYKDNLYALTQIEITRVEFFSDELNSRDTVQMLTDLDEQWKAYASEKVLDSEEYRVWGYLKNTLLVYLPMKQLISMSKTAQEYYEKSVSLDKNNALTYIQLGIWHLFSPKIAGGGIRPSIKTIKKGLNLARMDYHKYVGYVWLSQAYFKKGDDNEYKKALDAAVAVYGETYFIKEIIELNQAGKIVGE